MKRAEWIVEIADEGEIGMIDRMKVLYGLEQIADYTQRSDLQELMECAIALLKDQPDIVRCKDCVWWGTDGMCENSDSPCFQNGCTHGNWFCADGEKRKAKC